MFEDSLVESSGKLAGGKAWTTAASFAVQILLSGTVILISLIYTEALPQQRLIDILQAPAPLKVAVASRAVASSAKQTSEFDHNVLQLPREIPKSIAMVRDEAPPPGNAGGIAGDRPGGISDGSMGGVVELLRSSPVVLPKAAVQKLRVSSGVAQGLLLRKVDPQYPSLARQARIQGTVVLQAIIGKDGTVQNLRAISGHPMLIQSAVDAVKQWLYKPYYLNGEPIEVETQINVNFTLSGG
jgi:protein TonB